MSNLSIRPGGPFSAHIESVLRTAAQAIETERARQKIDAPTSSTAENALTVEDTKAFMAALEQMQSLAQLLGQFSAAFLAEMVMMYANQRGSEGPQTRAPSMRGRLPRGKFRSTRSTRGRSWRPKTPTRAPDSTAVNAAKNPLSGDGKKTAAFIDRQLVDKKSPAANAKSPSAGEMMVQAGKEHDVDPLVLLSISGHETAHGTKGVGMRKMLGVSAYDRNPNNVSQRFDGLRNQIFKGAKTFSRLRQKGGATSSDPIKKQLLAVNRAGWATDQNWHVGVGKQFGQLAADARAFGGESNGSVNGSPEQVAKIPNYQQLAPELQRAALDAVSMGLRVTSTTGGRHARTSNHYTHNQADGKGHAIDVGGDPQKLAAFYQKYATQNPRELFYDPIGGIKRGRQIGPIGGHGNHVHLAV